MMHLFLSRVGKCYRCDFVFLFVAVANRVLGHFVFLRQLRRLLCKKLKKTCNATTIIIHNVGFFVNSLRCVDKTEQANDWQSNGGCFLGLSCIKE